MFARILIAAAVVTVAPPATAQFVHDGTPIPIYPEVSETPADIPSPLTTPDGREYLVVALHDGTFTVVEVTLSAADGQTFVDAADFPALAATGLHDPAELIATETITGIPIEAITANARPGAMSQGGFLAADEDILGVLHGDNELVAAMGLTHAELARPLFHVWNLIRTDLGVRAPDRRTHDWRRVKAIRYNGGWVELDAAFYRGYQKSIFDDQLAGNCLMVLRRNLTSTDESLLIERYPRLDPERWDTLLGTLTRLYTGEMEAHYVQWYGFYEGHTPWRVDPIGIAHIFGLRTFEELDQVFPRRLPEIVAGHHGPGSNEKNPAGVAAGRARDADRSDGL